MARRLVLFHSVARGDCTAAGRCCAGYRTDCIRVRQAHTPCARHSRGVRLMDRWTATPPRRLFLAAFVATNLLAVGIVVPAAADPPASPAGAAALGLKQYVL